MIVFACVHGAGRSQMAAAFLNRCADPTKARAVAAGTEPATAVHPVVVEVMREVGIDLATAEPRLLTEKLAQGAALLVTMGCEERCPVVCGLRRKDCQLADPKGQPLEAVRAIRDEIARRVADLVHAHGWSAA